jgi:hypothetical protein
MLLLRGEILQKGFDLGNLRIHPAIDFALLPALEWVPQIQSVIDLLSGKHAVTFAAMVAHSRKHV